MGDGPSIFVVDLETTGFAANRNDRIVEVGIVELDADFNIRAEWSTLVNPQRDAGPKHVHGIESKWLFDAPTFPEIAPRAAASALAPQKGFIPALVAALPLTGDHAPSSLDYLSNLHKAFEDFELTSDEMQALTSLAAELGLSLFDVSNSHSKFFQDLAVRAWQDGILTDEEWSQLRYVGETIGISPMDIEIAKTGRGLRAETASSSLPLGLNEGDCVVLTGDMVPTQEEVSSLLVAAGLEVKGGVSKKVRLVIAADANSMSGKAAAARKLGITVISTEMFVAQWA